MSGYAMKSVIQFLQLSNHELLLVIELYKDNQSINLSLNDLMQYLYQNESKLSKSDSSFLYLCARLIKKFSANNHLTFGIRNDEHMAIFFEEAIKNKIDIRLKSEQHSDEKLKINDCLPIQIKCSQKNITLLLEVSFPNTNDLGELPFLILRSKKHIYCYCSGYLTQINEQFEECLGNLYDRKQIVLSETSEIKNFIQLIYKPFKQSCLWEIRADFKTLLPQEITPLPCLTINHNGHQLDCILSFQYNKQVVDANSQEKEIIDKHSGLKIARLFDMEGVYQKDLMDLYQKYNLPFLLANPGEIALFLDKVIPVLIEREWVVLNNVTDFTVNSEPVTIEFNVQSSGTDWFYFEANTSINDQKMPLHEIARLMIENQGYIKTKKGFVKLSDQSQQELTTLAKIGAFKVNQKFKQHEVVPFLACSNSVSSTPSVNELIKKSKGFTDRTQDISLVELNGELRSYQTYAVHWMNFLVHLNSGGILADDMGLGKTVQTLAFSSQYQQKGPILVICPTTVTYNWKKEVAKFLPTYTSLVYGGQNRHKQFDKFNDTDVIVISFGILKNDIDLFKQMTFKAIYVDEAQYIKNPNSQISKAIKQLQSHFKLCMTGTPIENHLEDIWNLFDFIMPGYLGTKKQFELLCGANEKETLKTKIKPFILRREKREVLDSLPEKTEILLKCPLSEIQNNLYKTILDATKKGIQTAKQTKNKLHMLTALLKLRQVCTHPGLIKEFQDKNMPSAKFDVIKEKCVELMAESHKVVLFSQFTHMLDIIEDWVTEQGYYFERIDGTVTGKNRIAAVDRFQSSDKPSIFLISLKAGGVGINLTAADYVIHCDPWWNPAVESQATDRVHRMGQKNKVIVYKLICEGTVEEKIQDLQTEKRKLLQELVDIDDGQSTTLNVNDLEAILS